MIQENTGSQGCTWLVPAFYHITAKHKLLLLTLLDVHQYTLWRECCIWKKLKNLHCKGMVCANPLILGITAVELWNFPFPILFKLFCWTISQSADSCTVSHHKGAEYWEWLVVLRFEPIQHLSTNDLPHPRVNWLCFKWQRNLRAKHKCHC